MAIIKVRKFQDIDEVEHFLNGGIFGGKDVSAGVRGLVGQTLTFTSPSSFTVTFVAGTTPPTLGDTNLLLFKDIASQVWAQSSNAVRAVQLASGRIAFIEASPSSGIAIAAAAELGKVLLGFSKDKAHTGTVYSFDPGSGVPPTLVSLQVSTSNSHIITTWE